MFSGNAGPYIRAVKFSKLLVTLRYTEVYSLSVSQCLLGETQCNNSLCTHHLTKKNQDLTALPVPCEQKKRTPASRLFRLNLNTNFTKRNPFQDSSSNLYVLLSGYIKFFFYSFPCAIPNH